MMLLFVSLCGEILPPASLFKILILIYQRRFSRRGRKQLEACSASCL